MYGKGGVGKTTLATNIGAALVEAGFSILLMGCDPKGDSSVLLNNGFPIPDVLGLIRTKNEISLNSIVHTGFKGIKCVELGNPFQTGTCASVEITRAFEELHRMKLFEKVAADYASMAEPLTGVTENFRNWPNRTRPITESTSGKHWETSPLSSLKGDHRLAATECQNFVGPPNGPLTQHPRD